MYYLQVPGHVKVYRTYYNGQCPVAKRRFRKRYYVIAFDEQGYEYMWRSPRYRWLWLARVFGPRDARAYIARGLAQTGPFNSASNPQGLQTRASIERIDL